MRRIRSSPGAQPPARAVAGEGVDRAVRPFHHGADAAEPALEERLVLLDAAVGVEAHAPDLLADQRPDQVVAAPRRAGPADERRARRRDRRRVDRDRRLEVPVVLSLDARPSVVGAPAQDVQLIVALVAVLGRDERSAARPPVEPLRVAVPEREDLGPPAGAPVLLSAAAHRMAGPEATVRPRPFHDHGVT
jgi:hypothetical protein